MIATFRIKKLSKVPEALNIQQHYYKCQYLWTTVKAAVKKQVLIKCLKQSFKINHYNFKCFLLSFYLI